MTQPRRRVIRPASPAAAFASTRLPRLQARLERQQAALVAWTTKLKRAFHSFEKHQRKFTAIQRQIRNLEQIP